MAVTGASGLTIPPRDQVALKMFPAIDDPGVDAEQATAIASMLRDKVVTALTQRTDEVVLDVGLDPKELATVVKQSPRLGPLNGLSGDTLRAAVGVVIGELVAAKYYNITYQVVNDDNRDGFNSDWINLRFAINGKQSYVVDFETSAMLSVDNGSLNQQITELQKYGFFQENASKSNELYKRMEQAGNRWENFKKGQERILLNQNGMPLDQLDKKNG